MRKGCWRLLLALSLALATSAVAGPREDVIEIAGLIEKMYFDPTRATEIAVELRKDVEAGAFDRYSDRSDLAVALTQRLKPIDAHFNVMWSRQPPVPGPPQASDRLKMEAMAKRRNYGFRNVERLPGNIGYIDLTVFAGFPFGAAGGWPRRAADAALNFVRDSDAVIVDLRSNGGGSPQMVGYLVSAFVKPDADVYNTFHSRREPSSERPRELHPEPMTDVPLYILTSASTGSGAESFAFTLQSCGRATIVGARSGGAANPGGIFPTSAGYAVFISTGRPRNPINGRNWEGTGVQPDIETAASDALVRAQEVALERILAGSVEGAERQDALWALEAMKARSQPYVPKKLNQYAGNYGPYRIGVAGTKLEARRDRRETLELVPIREDEFFIADDPSRRVLFERSSGQVTALVLRSSFGEEQRISRKEQSAASR